MTDGRVTYETAYRDGWRPEPRLMVSDWADEHRVLDSVKFLAGAGLGLALHESGH